MSSIAMSALRARGALFAGAKISSRANKVGTTGPRAAVPRVTAAASGDDEYTAQLSRALRTINTASVPVKTVKTAAKTVADREDRRRRRPPTRSCTL
jgi:hypothetical protein